MAVLHLLTTLTARIEAKTVRAWRSEALTSLIESAEFKEMLAKARGDLTTHVFNAIQEFFPIIKGDHTSLYTLYVKVISPAIDLAVTMQTSSTPYTLMPRIWTTTIGSRLLLSRDDLAYHKAVDVRTGKTLKKDSPVVANGQGTIGEQIAQLAPALWRSVAGENPVRLTQPIILVELYFPVRRRPANTTQSTKHQASGNVDHLA